MGIDYRSEVGIGYEVCESEYLFNDEAYDGDFLCYLEYELGEGFSCFSTGNCYSGNNMQYYVTVDNPFKDGLDLTRVKEVIDEELDRLELESCGEFGVVGGMLIY